MVGHILDSVDFDQWVLKHFLELQNVCLYVYEHTTYDVWIHLGTATQEARSL